MRGKMHWITRRGFGVCLVIVVTSFFFFIYSSSHGGRFSSLMSSVKSSSRNRGVAKGFLVHSPGCSIPDLDPLHPTIKGFFFKPKQITCEKPTAFTSSRGSTLYLHRDILHQNLPVIQDIYRKLFMTTSLKTTRPSTTTKTPSTTTKAPPNNSKAPSSIIRRPTTKSKRPSITIKHQSTTTKHPSITSHRHTPSPFVTGSPPTKSRRRKRYMRSTDDKVTVEDVKCCYKGIYREEQTREEADDSSDNRYRFSNTCIALNANATGVMEEAVLVVCRIGTVVVYKNVHYFFHREKFPSASQVIISLYSQVQRASHSSGMLGTQHTSSRSSTKGRTMSDRPTSSKVSPTVSKSIGNSLTPKYTLDYTTSTQTPTSAAPTARKQRIQDAEKLNVVIMGTDSASRLNMLRHLPKTYEYLTKDLGALDLKGFNKVADNTFYNSVAFLGGYNEEEAEKDACITKSGHYDDCHYVWEDFKRHHYVTAFMEDAASDGCFNYLRRGFITKPTDYYGHPFALASVKEIGHSKFCFGNLLTIKVVQNYALEFARTFLDSHFFGFFWSTRLTHDYINFLSLADEPHLQYLQEMEKMGALNNTALFFVSDHGMRWGEIRTTYIGIMEERLPFVVIYLPPWFRKKYQLAYDNLVDNTHRLTSNYDVHKTLLDLAYGRFADRVHVTSEPSRTKRGISLFRSIPWNRTCAEANIPTHYCTCQETHQLTKEEPDLVPATSHLLNTLNKWLQPYPQCEQFTKIKVVSARLSIPKALESKKDKTAVRTYLLQAFLTPGDALVEASIQHIKHDNSFKVIGGVSRINKYGSTSACVKDNVLRKYCYCKDQAKAKSIFSQLTGGIERK